MIIYYGVAFIFYPQSGTWPCGMPTREDDSLLNSDGDGVVRVLNIIEKECRLLSSRERCPFLVRMEVVETGLGGNDPKLYEQSDDEIKDDLRLLKEETQLPNLQASTIMQNDINLQPSKEEDNIPHLHVSGGMQNDEEFLSEEHKIFHSYHYEQSYRQHAFEELATKLINEGVIDEGSRHQRFLPQGTALLDKIYGTKWSQQCNIIRQSSPFGRIKGWKLASFIMKAGEDIRREALVMQIITKLNRYFEKHLTPWERPYLRPYTVMCVGGDSGLVECVPDCKNVDEVKKECVGFASLRDYFERAYGPSKHRIYASSNIASFTQNAPTPYSTGSLPPPTLIAAEGFEKELSFEQAQDNFLRSLVGYSLVCYILQIKDRHNA